MYSQSGHRSGSESSWGVVSHIAVILLMWVSFGLLSFLGSVVLYLMGRNNSPLTRSHLASAVNIQLTALIWIVISYVLMIIFIGFILLPIVGIVTTVLHILGIIHAAGDNEWKPPFCIRIFR